MSSEPGDETGMSSRSPDCDDLFGADDGLLTAELALALFFILLPLILFLGAVVQWPERQATAAIAASEGARAAALAENSAEAQTAMQTQVQRAVDASGIQNATITASITGRFEPGEHIAVTVTIDLPTIAVPTLPPLAGRQHSSTFVERVELHRGITS